MRGKEITAEVLHRLCVGLREKYLQYKWNNTIYGVIIGNKHGSLNITATEHFYSCLCHIWVDNSKPRGSHDLVLTEEDDIIRVAVGTREKYIDRSEMIARVIGDRYEIFYADSEMLVRVVELVEEFDKLVGWINDNTPDYLKQSGSQIASKGDDD